jgi:hypothetical protein
MLPTNMQLAAPMIIGPKNLCKGIMKKIEKKM